MARHDTASHAHDTTLRYSRPTREGLTTRGECRDTKFCIMTGARAWPLGVVSRYSLLCIVRGGRSGWRGVSRYKRLYRDRRAALAAGCVMRQATTRRLERHDMAKGACNTAGAGPVTRHPARHDTMQGMRGLGALCTQPRSVGCALGAPNPVLTQCTVLSHCLGTLFMNTVHKNFQKKKSK